MKQVMWFVPVHRLRSHTFDYKISKDSIEPVEFANLGYFYTARRKNTVVILKYCSTITYNIKVLQNLQNRFIMDTLFSPTCTFCTISVVYNYSKESLIILPTLFHMLFCCTWFAGESISYVYFFFIFLRNHSDFSRVKVFSFFSRAFFSRVFWFLTKTSEITWPFELSMSPRYAKHNHFKSF